MARRPDLDAWRKHTCGSISTLSGQVCQKPRNHEGLHSAYRSDWDDEWSSGNRYRNCTCKFSPADYGHSEDCPAWAIRKGANSMKFILNMHTETEAFEDEGEIPRILRKIAQDIEDGRDIAMFQTIHDVNGNDVGRYALKDASYV